MSLILGLWWLHLQTETMWKVQWWSATQILWKLLENLMSDGTAPPHHLVPLLQQVIIQVTATKETIPTPPSILSTMTKTLVTMVSVLRSQFTPLGLLTPALSCPVRVRIPIMSATTGILIFTQLEVDQDPDHLQSMRSTRTTVDSMGLCHQELILLRQPWST